MPANKEQSNQLVTHVETNLGKVCIRQSGKGIPMIFWPSLMMDGTMWDAQARHFKDRYTVVCIDSPGHGRSQPLTSTFTMEDCARCLKTIMDALNFEQAILVGNSWGGMLGGVFAAIYPEKTIAIVLMNCTASSAPLRQKIEYTLMTSIAGIFNRLPNYFVRRGVKSFAGKTTENHRPEVVSAIQAGIAAVNTKSVRWAIKSVVPLRKDQHTLLASIACPSLIVAGEEDRTFPVTETEKMATAIPNSQFVVLPEVGHLAALEQPELTNKLIDSFVSDAVISSPGSGP